MIKLISKYGYEDAPEQERRKICNGCGVWGWKGWIIPDKILGLNISEACNIHDYMYYYGETEYGKDLADKTFLHNMYILINEGSWWLRWIRKRIARKYYLAVKYFGYKAFTTTKRTVVRKLSKVDFNLDDERFKQFLKREWEIIIV